MTLTGSLLSIWSTFPSWWQQTSQMKCLPTSTRLMSQFLLCSDSGKGRHLPVHMGCFLWGKLWASSQKDIWTLLHKLLSWASFGVGFSARSAFRIGRNNFCPAECLECPCIDLVCFHFYPFSFLFDKPGRSQGLVASDFLPWPVLLPPRTEPLRADLSTRYGAGTGHPPTLGLVQLLHLWGGKDWFSLFREGGKPAC